jgi:hypothetical protein
VSGAWCLVPGVWQAEPVNPANLLGLCLTVVGVVVLRRPELLGLGGGGAREEGESAGEGQAGKKPEKKTE